MSADPNDSNSEEVLELDQRANPSGGHVEILTLNRPQAMNSFSRQLIVELESNIARISADPAVRAVILTGRGRAFSAGADLKERATMAPDEVRDFLNRVGTLFRSIETLRAPVIAAINGFALGGGLELALCADIRIAADEAVVGLPETSLGIIPGAGGTQRLPRIVGRARAKEMVLTAARISAAEALDVGLVTRTVPAAGLADAAEELAFKIAANAPIALTQAKRAIDQGLDVGIDEGLKIERREYEVTIPTRDRTEALTAFKEKRKPIFQGA